MTSRWAHNPQVDDLDNRRYATCRAMDFKGNWDKTGKHKLVGPDLLRTMTSYDAVTNERRSIIEKV